MEEDELPSYFILTMEEIRFVLEEIGKFLLDDDEFMLDILSKLPEGKEGELGPYQVERRLIEPKINDKNMLLKSQCHQGTGPRAHSSLATAAGPSTTDCLTRFTLHDAGALHDW